MCVQMLLQSSRSPLPQTHSVMTISAWGMYSCLRSAGRQIPLLQSRIKGGSIGVLGPPTALSTMDQLEQLDKAGEWTDVSEGVLNQVQEMWYCNNEGYDEGWWSDTHLAGGITVLVESHTEGHSVGTRCCHFTRFGKNTILSPIIPKFLYVICFPPTEWVIRWMTLGQAHPSWVNRLVSTY